MDCTVHGVAKSQTQLSDFHFTIITTKSKKALRGEKNCNKKMALGCGLF